MSDTLLTIETGDYPVVILKGAKRGTRIVKYGADETVCRDYSQLVNAIGTAVAHAMTCQGMLDGMANFDD